jgi:broad specificity phosphatase PhoE
VIVRTRAIDGDTVLFAHGHVLRVLAARWIGLTALGGQHFMLRTGAVSVLGFYQEIPAIRVWNASLLN